MFRFGSLQADINLRPIEMSLFYLRKRAFVGASTLIDPYAGSPIIGL